MLALAYKIDQQLIITIDGFCEHLQKQIGLPFGWMLILISIGTAAIALTASLLMFQDHTMRSLFIFLWGITLVSMILFFWKGLWPQMRDWPKDLFLRHWSAVATILRQTLRPLRLTTLAGTTLLLPGAFAPFTWGDPDKAIRSLLFLFVSIAPITIMMYAFCAMPHDSRSNP